MKAQMTVKEKFEKWFENESISREGTISEAIRVKVLKEEKSLLENAYTAGHKEGRKSAFGKSQEEYDAGIINKILMIVDEEIINVGGQSYDKAVDLSNNIRILSKRELSSKQETK